jgi:hypothetical protein
MVLLKKSFGYVSDSKITGLSVLTTKGSTHFEGDMMQNLVT